jgi:hypothetical protein
VPPSVIRPATTRTDPAQAKRVSGRSTRLPATDAPSVAAIAAVDRSKVPPLHCSSIGPPLPFEKRAQPLTSRRYGDHGQ